MDISENRNLSFWKGIACILIISLHCELGGQIGWLIDITSRMAVPLFFCTSGYYLKELSHKDALADLRRKIKNTLILFIYAVMLYFLCQIIVAILFKKESIQEFANIYFNWSTIILFFTGNKVSLAEHLWFIHALLYCYGVYFLVLKTRSIKIMKYLTDVKLSFGLLVMGYFIRLYFLEHKVIIVGYDLSKVEFYRNWLFTGLPFFNIGRYLKSSAIRWRKVSNSILCGLLLTGYMLSLVERIIINEKLEFYLGTILFVFCLFLYIIHNPQNCWSNKMAKIGKNLSMPLYIIHPMVIVLFDFLWISREWITATGIVPLIKFIVVTCCSFIMSYIWISFHQKAKGKG